jgi:(E)-2-((N-methylformamido)methylene)succinate hydrolase
MATNGQFPILKRKHTAHGAAYVERGSGNPLILVHGVGMRAEYWSLQLESLAHHARVFVVDMPGHGLSQAIAEGSHIPEYIAWFGQFFDDLALEKVSFAGHSMGAMIASGVVATYPARIERVAFLSGTGRRGPDKRAESLARAAAIRDRSVDQEAALKRWYGDDYPALTEITRAWLATVNWQGYATAYHAYAAGDEVYCDVWPRVTCPVLFLAGDRDGGTPVELIHELAAITPKAKGVIINGHAHMVPLTAANAVTRHLLDWLAAE